MTLPNFIMIGVAKAGTTSFWHYLDEHPQVYMTPIKATNYFGYEDARDWKWQDEGEAPMIRNFPVHTWEEYEASFAGANGETAIGEASPQYFRCPTAAQRIHDALPDAKLILSLRNPAERAFSGFMMRTRRGEAVRGFHEELLTLDSSHVKEGFYYQRLKRYLDLFPREQMKIYLFDDFKKDASGPDPRPVRLPRRGYGFQPRHLRPPQPRRGAQGPLAEPDLLQPPAHRPHQGRCPRELAGRAEKGAADEPEAHAQTHPRYARRPDEVLLRRCPQIGNAHRPRPLRLAELNAMVTNQMTLPDFLGIGVQRGGTTWLHTLLASHPDVFMPSRRKEIRFFEKYYDRGLGWYSEFFCPPAEASRYKAIGEISTQYYDDEASPRRIHADLPEAKLIIMLRHPVSRAYSHYGFVVQRMNYRGTFEEFLASRPKALEKGLLQPLPEQLPEIFRPGTHPGAGL